MFAGLCNLYLIMWNAVKLGKLVTLYENTEKALNHVMVLSFEHIKKLYLLKNLIIAEFHGPNWNESRADYQIELQDGNTNQLNTFEQFERNFSNERFKVMFLENISYNSIFIRNITIFSSSCWKPSIAVKNSLEKKLRGIYLESRIRM